MSPAAWETFISFLSMQQVGVSAFRMSFVLFALCFRVRVSLLNLYFLLFVVSSLFGSTLEYDCSLVSHVSLLVYLAVLFILVSLVKCSNKLYVPPHSYYLMKSNKLSTIECIVYLRPYNSDDRQVAWQVHH